MVWNPFFGATDDSLFPPEANWVLGHPMFEMKRRSLRSTLVEQRLPSFSLLLVAGAPSNWIQRQSPTPVGSEFWLPSAEESHTQRPSGLLPLLTRVHGLQHFWEHCVGCVGCEQAARDFVPIHSGSAFVLVSCKMAQWLFGLISFWDRGREAEKLLNVRRVSKSGGPPKGCLPFS